MTALALLYKIESIKLCLNKQKGVVKCLKLI